MLANAGAPAQSRAQAIHETALPPDSAHHINRVTFDTLDIRMTARDRAVAKGVVSEVGTNAKGPITERIRFVDTWVRRQHRWLCISSLFTPVKDPSGRGRFYFLLSAFSLLSLGDNKQIVPKPIVALRHDVADLP